MLTVRLGVLVAQPSPALMSILVGPRMDDPGVIVFQVLIYINFWWSLLNLLPIWPLDGGQLDGHRPGDVQPVQRPSLGRT